MPPLRRRTPLLDTPANGFKYVVKPSWGTPESESFHVVTALGAYVADAIATDDGQNGIVSADGPDTFAQLRPLLIQLNKFQGMVTYVSQALNDGLQRPYIDLIVHDCLLPLFAALGTDDTVLVLANHIPITLTLGKIKPDANMKWLRNMVQINPLATTCMKEGDVYYVQNTNSATKNKIMQEQVSDALSEVAYSLNRVSSNATFEEFNAVTLKKLSKHLNIVSVIWVKRNDLEGFIATVKKYLDGKVDFRRKLISKIIEERERSL